MLDFIFVLIAAGLSGAPQDAGSTAVAQTEPAVSAPSTPSEGASTVTMGEGTVSTGAGVVVEGSPVVQAPSAATTSVPQVEGMNMAVVPAGLVAEPQTPSGKFMTATEVKPILGATRGNWVAIREFNGQDLLYVTHLWSWRCGLAAMAISVNDEPMQNWPLPPCHEGTAQPNAITDSDGQPYLTLKLGAVQKVAIQLVYDDLSMERAEFTRPQVLMP